MIAILLLALQDNPAAQAAPREGAWMKRHEELVAEAKKGDSDLLFLGDSITEGWRYNGRAIWKREFGDRKPANFGIGGDSTNHVLWRIRNGELDGLKPKAIVLMIGTNNIGRHTPEQIAGGVEAIVAEIRKRLPEARILLLGVFPRGEKPGKVREDVKAINEGLSKIQEVTYLEIGSKFVGDEGVISKEIMPDFLHLSAKGYQIWADAIREPLGKLLGK